MRADRVQQFAVKKTEESATFTQSALRANPPETSRNSKFQSNSKFPSTNSSNVTQPVRSSNTEMARVQSFLDERVAEARRQSQRISKLYKEKRRLHRQSQRLRQELGKLEYEKGNIEEGYNHIIENAVRPYARKRKLEFNDSNWEFLDPLLNQLFQDAIEAESLRGHIQVLQDLVKAQSDELNSLQDKLRKTHSQLRESASQTQAPQHMIMGSRADVEIRPNEVRPSQFQLQLSRNKVQTLQDQLQASRNQVKILQNQLLAGVDKVYVYTDDQLNQDFRALIALVKSLSRSVRVAQHANVTGTLEPWGLLKGVAGRHWDSRARIKSYIEAWIWSVLVEKLFSRAFGVFGKFGEHLNEDWSYLFSTGNPLPWPEPSTSCEKWRYTTMEQLVNMVGRSAIIQGQADVAIRSNAGATAKYWIKAVIKNRDEVAQTIGEKLLSISSAVDISRISHIIDKAFSLAHQMSLQRSRILVIFPLPGADFVNGEMESMPDRNGNDMAEGRVAFIVNPGLTKWGDANGKKLEQRHNIVLPLVQLEELNTKREVHGV
jgi:hypothetical protein